MAKDSPHSGHRDRMREKYITNGRDALSDHELLEMLLYYCIPRKNTNELAHSLIDTFGSFSAVMDASVSELTEAGLSKNSAVYLTLVREAARSYYLSKGSTPRFVTVGDAAEYITKLLYGVKEEQFHIFLMDMKMRLVSHKMLAEGGLDSVTIDTRALLKTALASNAAYAIIAHNHPTGNATPTKGDLSLTHSILDILGSVGIKLCDHIIVSGDDFYSFNRGGGIENTQSSTSLTAHQYAEYTL